MCGLRCGTRFLCWGDGLGCHYYPWIDCRTPAGTSGVATALFARLGVDDPVSMIAALASTQGARLAQLAAPLDQGAINQPMIQQAAWAFEQWQLHNG